MKLLYTTFLSLLAFVACDRVDLTTVDNILPQPTSVQLLGGKYVLPHNATLALQDSTLCGVADYSRYIVPDGYDVTENIGGTGDIKISYDRSLDSIGGYNLNITTNGIDIHTGSYGGAVCALSTLRQLLPTSGKVVLPTLNIVDKPRFGWRGIHLDSSRHFFTVTEVMKLLDKLAQYKFNKFHWHLTDDQGWRIEIKSIPELTTTSAWRDASKHDQDIDCEQKAIANDDPYMHLPLCNFIDQDRNNYYGGYYTQEEIRAVVAYATKLGIDIVPEIDMPGHSLGLLNVMPELSCAGKPVWGRFFTTPLCLGNDKTIEIAKQIYSEIFDLFPYKYVHLGADEVAQEHWAKCPKCQRRIHNLNLKDEHGLQAWFVREMADFFAAHGKTLMGWDEIVADDVPSSSMIHWWRGWSPQSFQKALINGHNVVISHSEYFYLDNTEDDRKLENLYNYDPMTTVPKANVKQIMGVQGNIWTERIPTYERLCYQIFPRFFAIAELGWCDPTKKDFENFEKRLLVHLQRIDAEGVNYRIPSLTGFYDYNEFVGQTSVKVGSKLDDIKIRYTTDGSIPNQDSPLYTQPILIKDSCTLSLRAYTAYGKVGRVQKAIFVPTTFRPAVETTLPTKKGLCALWYDYDGEECDKIETAPLNEQITDITATIPPQCHGNIGLIFDGYFVAPCDDVYAFYTFSDDGSMLYIDNTLVVNNDKAHSREERTGTIALAKGLHKLHMSYFDSNGGYLEAGLIKDNVRVPFTKDDLCYE